jgi:hypothetical protein
VLPWDVGLLACSHVHFPAFFFLITVIKVAQAACSFQQGSVTRHGHVDGGSGGVAAPLALLPQKAIPVCCCFGPLWRRRSEGQGRMDVKRIEGGWDGLDVDGPTVPGVDSSVERL